MTIKSWRAEFMPKMPTKKLTKRQAIEHSLRKWEGLTEKNLQKHGLEKGSKSIIAPNSYGLLEINDKTCALCRVFLDKQPPDDESECYKCPLYETLGKPCDGYYSPYNEWLSNGNPLPMIKALKKTLKGLDKKEGKS